MKRSFRSKNGQAPRYPTLQDGRRLLLAGIIGPGILSLAACGVTTPYDDDDQTTVVGRDASRHPHPYAPDADDMMMGVAPGPGLDAETPPPLPDAGEFMMGEAPAPGLDASVPEQAPDAGDFFMGDIAAPELDAATPPPPGPDASDLMMGGMALPEDAGD